VQRVNFTIESSVIIDLAASIGLVVVILFARLLAIRFVRTTEASPQEQRRWITNIKNAFFLVALTGIVLIWAPQLRTLALSLTAVVAAVVVATKELLLCLSGAVVRASSKSFVVGDWIEVAGVRGEVIDYTLFVTTLQELEASSHGGRHSANTVTVPNSVFLVGPIRKLNHIKDHLFHRFAVTADPGVDLLGRRGEIEKAIQGIYAPFRDQALRARDLLEKSGASSLPEVGPRIQFSTTDLGKLRVTVTVFIPLGHADLVENEVTCAILAILTSADQAASTVHAADVPSEPAFPTHSSPNHRTA
jgi:small-conductance mechanosensitive channel